MSATELEIGQPCIVHRGGDPAIPVAFDGLTGKVIGHSTMMLDGTIVPTVGVLFDSGITTWIVRWHVNARPETWQEKFKRKARARLREVLES